MNDIRQIPNGFSYEAEYRDRARSLGSDAPAEESFSDLLGYETALDEADELTAEELRPEPAHIRRLREDLARLRDDVEAVRLRIGSITEQSATVMRTQVKWLDASAHAQLGGAPWAKLAGAMLATAIGNRLLARLPLGAIFSTIGPIAVRTLIQTPSKRR